MNEELYFDQLSDGTTWPSIDSDLAWLMRYGKIEDVIEIRLIAAQALSAYIELVRESQSRRNIICKELRGLERERAF